MKNDPKTVFNPSECKEDIIRMIAQYLGDESYTASKSILLDEENIKRKERADKTNQVRRVKKAILEGDWPEVDRIFSIEALVKNQKPFLYSIYKQQFLEYIEHREVQKAFTHLTKRIKPLETYQSTPSDMCYLLSAKSLHEVPSFKLWQGITTSREILANEFQLAFDLESTSECEDIPVPPERLLTMLRQAVTYQISQCRVLPTITPKAVVIPNTVKHTFTGHKGNVKCVNFIGQGDLIASGSSDNTVRVWNTWDPEDSFILEGHTSRIWDLDSTKDGKFLASASGDGDVRIWDVEQKVSVGVLRDGARDVYGVKFHPAGKHLVTGSYDKTVRLYDVERGVVIKTFSGHASSVSSCIFSPLGNLLVTGSKDNTIKFWDIVSGLCIRTITTLGEVTSVDMNSSGGLLLSSSKDNSSRIWDTRLSRPIQRLKGHQNTKSAFAGETLVVGGSEDGAGYIWDVETGGIVSRLVAHTGIVYNLAWNPRQSLFCSCSDDKTLKTWWFDENKLI